MPGGYPLIGQVCHGVSIGANPTSNPAGTSVTAGAANVKGTWTQLIAATTVDCTMLLVTAINKTGSTTAVIDIGVGVGGSEKIIVADMSMAWAASTSYSGSTVLIPCQIPAGARIAARAQSNAGADAYLVTVQTFDGGFAQTDAPAGMDSIGFVTATTKGTSITSGNSAYSAYVAVTTATARDYIGLLVGLTNLGAGLATATGNLGIAIGAGGSEQDIIPDLPIGFYGPNAALIFPLMSGFLPISIPSGTRLAVKAATGGLSQAFGVILYGVYQ